MNFNKKVIVSKHAVERMEQRHLEMTSKKHKKYLGNQMDYVKNMIRMDRIKRMEKKPDGTTVVTTKDNYLVYVRETKTANVIVTVVKRNRKRLGVLV